MNNQTANHGQNQFQCDGINVTLHFLPCGKTLQMCIAELLRIHMEK